MKKKKLLIIGTAPNRILDFNIKFLSFLLGKKYDFYFFSTKKYLNNNIIEYYLLKEKKISINKKIKINLKQFDEIIVCQGNENLFEFLNVFLWLKNNGLKELLVINSSNNIFKRNLRRYNIFYFYFYKIFYFYRNYYLLY
ncbi:MAG: hypothetical protein C0601_02750 [Candidatus Muiribacterium halophilum]|uniref:Uncharacterized protein n=1 Tax=Muiribacterium halophilum TaxID=2053465 RepID=A0A2N5ZK98_MUIH1|nr:MAG: hypothetical protein C0601_02750 [Candidatus Muirbacterium halophilum]